MPDATRLDGNDFSWHDGDLVDLFWLGMLEIEGGPFTRAELSS